MPGNAHAMPTLPTLAPPGKINYPATRFTPPNQKQTSHNPAPDKHAPYIVKRNEGPTKSDPDSSFHVSRVMEPRNTDARPFPVPCAELQRDSGITWKNDLEPGRARSPIPWSDALSVQLSSELPCFPRTHFEMNPVGRLCPKIFQIFSRPETKTAPRGDEEPP